MDKNITFLMSNAQFKVGLLPKLTNPDLLVRADENGYYEIAVRINPYEVLRVASATQDEIIQKIEYWKHRVKFVKQDYKVL